VQELLEASGPKLIKVIRAEEPLIRIAKSEEPAPGFQSVAEIIKQSYSE